MVGGGAPIAQAASLLSCEHASTYRALRSAIRGCLHAVLSRVTEQLLTMTIDVVNNNMGGYDVVTNRS